MSLLECTAVHVSSRLALVEGNNTAGVARKLTAMRSGLCGGCRLTGVVVTHLVVIER